MLKLYELLCWKDEQKLRGRLSSEIPCTVEWTPRTVRPNAIGLIWSARLLCATGVDELKVHSPSFSFGKCIDLVWHLPCVERSTFHIAPFAWTLSPKVCTCIDSWLIRSACEGDVTFVLLLKISYRLSDSQFQVRANKQCLRSTWCERMGLFDVLNAFPHFKLPACK